MLYTETNIIHVNPANSEKVLVSTEALEFFEEHQQRALPKIAADQELYVPLLQSARDVRTKHQVLLNNSVDMSGVDDESVHLVVTSPPYWNIKEYEKSAGQLGLIDEYDKFVTELTKVFSECLRVLVPGGRVVVVVGDVLVPRRQLGRHVVFPLHSSIQEECRKLGFDNLAPIIWNKIGNVTREVGGSSSFLGKPYEPNAIIKNDIEYILFQRKPGGYRHVRPEQRLSSVIPKPEYGKWFRQIWEIGGASTKSHPAPFPLKLAERLVRMFSFVEDTVLDPFSGSGTTNLAAAKWGRNSIGFDVEPSYVNKTAERINDLVRNPRLFEQGPGYEY